MERHAWVPRGLGKGLLGLLLGGVVGACFAACGVDGVTPDCSSPDAGCGFVILDATVDGDETSVDATSDTHVDADADARATDADAARDGDAKADR